MLTGKVDLVTWLTVGQSIKIFESGQPLYEMPYGKKKKEEIKMAYFIITKFKETEITHF